MFKSPSQNANRFGKTRPAAISVSRRSQAICVVDPQADDYRGWNAVAEANGLRLEVVATAAAALRLARSGEIDLWVVNTNLPGLSGYELCGMLKSRAPQTVVYLVADEYSAAAEQAAWAARATMFGCKGSQDDLLQQWLQSRSSLHSPLCATSDANLQRFYFHSS